MVYTIDTSQIVLKEEGRGIDDATPSYRKFEILRGLRVRSRLAPPSQFLALSTSRSLASHGMKERNFLPTSSTG